MHLSFPKSLVRALVVVSSLAMIAIPGCASEPTDDELEAAAIAEEATLGTSSDELTSFTCDGTEDVNQQGLGKGSGSLRKVRAAAHPAAGFDRFVMEFQRNVDPRAYLVRRETSTSFSGTCDPEECPPTKVAGTHAIRVVFQNGTMVSSFTGARRLTFADAKGIKEAAEYDQFEGNIEWALGTQRNPCFRTFTLNSPPRLVVDVKR